MIKPLPPPRRPRPLAQSSPQPAPSMAHPPASEGIDAVTAWVNQVNLAQMSAQDKSKKAVALQALISAFGRVRTARQGSREFVQKVHKRFMQGRRADLLIVDDVTDERPR